CPAVITVLGANGATIQRSIEDEFAALVESGHLQAELAAAHRRGSDGLEMHFARNPRWKSGRLSSVQVGPRDALHLGPRGVLVLPVDHPSVKPETVRALANVLDMALAACRPKERRDFRYAVVPRHRRHRGHPVALSATLAHDIAVDKDAHDLSDAIR